MDAATGLLYVGNGQYYDPATGRFLSRDAKPNNSNPYVPWDPTGAIVGPLAAMALFSGRKKKGSKVATLLALILVGASAGMTLAACGSGPTEVTAVITPDGTAIITFGPTTVVTTAAAVTEAANIDVTEIPCLTPLENVPVPTGTPIPPPTMIPPPANPTEEQMKEYIASFGITLSGNWTGILLTNLWEALFTHIGYQDLRFWLNGRTATLTWGGSRDCGGLNACYGGSTPGDTITLKATGMVNPVINILHEIGHLVDNLWYDYFTTQLETTTFTLNGQYHAGWDGTSYKSLPASGVNDVRLIALRSSLFGGQDAWQQRGGTPSWEDWADIFSNSMIHNINQASDLGGQMDSFFIKMKNHAMGR